jgi:hypothetical protein
MRAEIFLQNIINILLVAIVLQVAVMSVFSLKIIKDIAGRPLDSAKDIIILLISLYLCWKVPFLTVFRGTGLAVPHIFDMVMCALMLSRFVAFVDSFFQRLKLG